MTDSKKFSIVKNYIKLRKETDDTDLLLQLFAPDATIVSYEKEYQSPNLGQYYVDNPKPFIGPTSVSDPVLVDGNVYIELYFSIFKTVKVTYEIEGDLIRKMAIS